MALSLLLALFDINDEAALAQAAANNPDSPAGQYHRMSNDQKRRVMAALYDAFYTILEAHKLDFVLAGPNEPLSANYGSSGGRASKALGQALARIISGDLPINANIQDLENTIQEIKDDRNVRELKDILRRYARQAIADISA
jgi:hypothetical protein